MLYFFLPPFLSPFVDYIFWPVATCFFFYRIRVQTSFYFISIFRLVRFIVVVRFSYIFGVCRSYQTKTAEYV